MKKYFLTGLIVLLPFALTVMIVVYLFDFFTNPFVGIVESILKYYEKEFVSEKFIVIASRVISFVFLLFLIFILGLFAQKFFFKAFLKFTDNILSKVPIVKTIYKLSNDVSKAIFTQGQKTFKQTVLIPFPSDATHALGFITGDVPESIRKAANDAEVSVFIPTAPHPISGFLLLAPKKHLHEVDITTEETFKFLLSFGTFNPGDEPKP